MGIGHEFNVLLPVLAFSLTYTPTILSVTLPFYSLLAALIPYPTSADGFLIKQPTKLEPKDIHSPRRCGPLSSSSLFYGCRSPQAWRASTHEPRPTSLESGASNQEPRIRSRPSALALLEHLATCDSWTAASCHCCQYCGQFHTGTRPSSALPSAETAVSE